MALVGVVAAAVLWLAYSTLTAGERKIAWADVTHRLPQLEPERAGVKSFHSRRELERYLETEAPPGRTRIAQLDFRRDQLALISAGARSSTGYTLRVLDVTEHRRRIVVTVRQRAPRLGDPAEARPTFPYRLISFRSSDKPVELSWEGGR